jgi:subtilisin-like proprotein convertase family protein
MKALLKRFARVGLRLAAVAAVCSPGLAQASSVTITPGVSITDNSSAETAFNIVVSDSGIITEVWLDVAWTHTWIGDLVIGLESPWGDRLAMLRRPGVAGSAATFGDSSDLSASFPITFRDGSANDAETMGNTISPTGVVCRDDARCSYFPNPDGYATSNLTNFAGFAGNQVQGTWRAFFSDNAGGDTGPIESITLNYEVVEAVPEPATLALVSLGALVAGRRLRQRGRI